MPKNMNDDDTLKPILDTRPKAFVFVLMPFSDEFRDVYELGIKPACQAANAYSERVDEQIFQESILERIYNQIAKADLIIADMTGRNPNVFYETGYAHALGKKVILLTNQSDDIPFDLKHYQHIIYEGSIVSIKDELESSINWHLQQPTVPMIDPLHALDFFCLGNKIVEGVEIEIPLSIANISLKLFFKVIDITVKNVSNHVLRFEPRIYITLVFPDSGLSAVSSTTKLIQMPDGKHLKSNLTISDLLPNALLSSEYTLNIDLNQIAELSVPAILRIYTARGTEDIPFLFWLDVPSSS